MAHDVLAPPSYIPGIYNYCDQWCARCLLSDRCRIYVNLRRRAGSAGSPAVGPGVTAQIVQQGFEDALQLLQRAAVACGVPLQTIEDEAAAQQAAMERRREELKAHRLVRLATQYLLLLAQWFHAEGQTLRARVHEAVAQAKANANPDVDVPALLLELDDHIAVIEHDERVIAAKTWRALHGALERRDRSGEPPTSDAAAAQTDENGSAKVAVLAIDRSLAAWRGIARFHPEAADTIAVIDEWLEELRDGLERSFPLARQFRRPGFDTGRAPAVRN